jgi:SAM-dependent methyltransferase
MDFSLFDARHYETRAVAEGYRAWAPIYDKTVRPELDLELLERLRSVPWDQARAAADLACGTGRIGAWLRDRGVLYVDGVDQTPEMLGHAWERSAYRSLSLSEMTSTPFEAGAYNLVTNVLAVEHAPDVGALYREAARLVRPGGHFVLIGYHPHFLLNGIPTHFDDESGCSIAIVNFVHLFSDHVRAANEHGWQLAELEERIVDDEWVGREPRWSRHHGRPVSFAAAWRRERSEE